MLNITDLLLGIIALLSSLLVISCCWSHCRWLVIHITDYCSIAKLPSPLCLTIQLSKGKGVPKLFNNQPYLKLPLEGKTHLTVDVFSSRPAHYHDAITNPSRFWSCQNYKFSPILCENLFMLTLR